ncbi:hypothetical protein TCARB_0800 [Thermofilum adornatum 1505]|uniref:Uncharacterized protein n=1 Tax=Thermofilum adornatum 1505 TaxID=697581 RepID=A0A3G1A518_9CREN|nr:hypothetical protein TCARB_0800 [Thermofilum adornatum 1505]
MHITSILPKKSHRQLTKNHLGCKYPRCFLIYALNVVKQLCTLRMIVHGWPGSTGVWKLCLTNLLDR